jgi:hypothetical protein
MMTIFCIRFNQIIKKINDFLNLNRIFALKI